MDYRWSFPDTTRAVHAMRWVKGRVRIGSLGVKRGEVGRPFYPPAYRDNISFVGFDPKKFSSCSALGFSLSRCTARVKPLASRV